MSVDQFVRTLPDGSVLSMLPQSTHPHAHAAVPTLDWQGKTRHREPPIQFTSNRHRGVKKLTSCRLTLPRARSQD